MNDRLPSQYLTLKQRLEFADKGYIIFCGVFNASDFDRFNQAFLHLVEKRSSRRFSTPHDSRLCHFFDENPQIESEVYNAVRTTPQIRQLATDSRIARLLWELFPERPFGLLEKMILRIDPPGWEHEVAHWHQDYFYVRGNTEIVTAWIPLQAVNHSNGCLLVAPSSHRLGIINHTERIGKRHCPPANVRDSFNPMEVEMELGDALLFHTLLFHSGQLNCSDATRYSFQFRYSPFGLPIDPAMGNLTPLMQE